MTLTKKDLQNIGSLMEEKLEPVKKDIKRVETKVDGVEKKVDSLETRVISVEKNVSTIESKVSTIEKKVDELTEFVVPAIGNLLQWTDDIHRAIVGKPTKHVS